MALVEVGLDTKVEQFIKNEVGKKVKEELANFWDLWQKNWLLAQAKGVWEKEWDKEWQEIWE